MGFQDNWLITPEQLRDETPSRFDGLSYEQEMHLRTQACFHVDRLRNCRRPSEATLDFIKQHVVSTAKLLLHRFYTQHSFKTHAYEDVALAALFLAAKVEDRPIKVVTLLNKHFLLQDPQHQDYVEKSREQECVRVCAFACKRACVRVYIRACAGVHAFVRVAGAPLACVRRVRVCLRACVGSCAHANTQ
jgi:hypothetical protein